MISKTEENAEIYFEKSHEIQLFDQTEYSKFLFTIKVWYKIEKKLELAIFWTLDSVNGVSILGHSLPNLLNGRLRFEVMASKRQSVKISHFYKSQPLMRLPKRMDNFITKQRKMHFQNLSTEWTYNIKIIFHVPKKYEWLISIILAKSKEINEFVLVVISVVNKYHLMLSSSWSIHAEYAA